MTELNVHDHRRDHPGLSYTYPVVSRRSGGLSLGINLTPNNACNWACVYCQVPDLQRGASPPIDLERLEEELRWVLASIQSGDFYDQYHVPSDSRSLRDIALSGNGEPTACPQFQEVIAIIGRLCAEFDLLGTVSLVLITNGSLLGKSSVRTAIAHWGELGGVVWFKLDRATREGMIEINQVHGDPATQKGRLLTCTTLCPTWVQTCLFEKDGQPPSAEELCAYKALMKEVIAEAPDLLGILLYGLARPSMQPGADRLSPLPEAWLREFAETLQSPDIEIKVYP